MELSGARVLVVGVLEARPGPLDTGFAHRPVAGTAPPPPGGGDPRRPAGAAADKPAADAELLPTRPDGMPVVERRAR
ncbi:hypothetical protein ACIGO6_36015 [Streptomyces sp. NPDC053750]|uniref:hypothetical protein n=1 Tax=Streptomyces sp. NPDC053750 TaxID=3365714 RepID=UPI0037D1AA56